MKFSRGSSLLAAAAIALLGSAAGTQAFNQGPGLQPISNGASPTKGQANKTATAKKQTAAVRSGIGSSRGNKYPAPGWSVAQDRRNARKRRNVLRHRASRKG